MKNIARKSVYVLLCMALITSGCSVTRNANNKQKGAVIGASGGAVIGGVLGNNIGEGINVTFTEDAGVYFDTNKSNVKGTSAATLDKLAGIFKEYPKSNILVEGHTDSAGPEDYNMKLSQQRAESVTNYLIAQGISATRFSTKWYGENQPKADNATAEGKSKNRRVELAIVASEELKEEAQQNTKG